MLSGMVGFSGAAVLPPVAKQDVADGFADPFANASGLHEKIALVIYPQMTTFDLVGPIISCLANHGQRLAERLGVTAFSPYAWSATQ